MWKKEKLRRGFIPEDLAPSGVELHSILWWGSHIKYLQQIATSCIWSYILVDFSFFESAIWFPNSVGIEGRRQSHNGLLLFCLFVLFLSQLFSKTYKFECLCSSGISRPLLEINRHVSITKLVWFYIHLWSIYSTEQNRWVTAKTKIKDGEHIGKAAEKSWANFGNLISWKFTT